MKAGTVILAASVLAACATLPVPRKTLTCQSDAQWVLNDAQGKPKSGVYICFGDDGVLLYQTRTLTAEQIQKLTTPAASPAAKTSPAKKPAAK